MNQPKNLAEKLKRIEGYMLNLRLIERSDAEYVYGLRTNSNYNRHLSKVSEAVEGQRKWVMSYKAREDKRQELYYIVERRDGVRCGTVRLYEIKDKSFTWGSWILDRQKPPKAALESATLSFRVGFHVLSLANANIKVNVGNKHAIAFYRRFGMTEVGRSDEEIFFNLSREKFAALENDYITVLLNAADD